MSEITLKVSHEGTVRRFRMPANTKWPTLQSHLASIFALSISPSLIALSYTDEDGDIVQLNSDEELQDVLQQCVAAGRKMIKFGIVELEELDKDYAMIAKPTKEPEPEPEPEQAAASDAPVEEQAEQSIVVKEPAVAEPVPEAVVEEPPAKEEYVHVEEQDAPPEYQSFVEPEASTSTEKGKQPEQEEQEEQQEQPSMASELEGLIRDFVSIMVQNPEFVQRATTFKDRVMNGGNINIDLMAKFFERGTSEAKPSEHKEKDINMEYNWDVPPPTFGEGGPSLLMRGCGQTPSQEAREFGPPMGMRGHWNMPHRGPFMGNRGCFFRAPEHSDSGEEGRRRGRCGRGRGRCRRRETRPEQGTQTTMPASMPQATQTAMPFVVPQATQTAEEPVFIPPMAERRAPPPVSVDAQIKDYVGFLAEMGFTDEHLNLQLLERYNGNLEAVIDVLTKAEYEFDAYYS